MADNVMTFRLVVKQVATDLGVYATFMPKPIEGAFGSGMHTHLSLFEGDVNAFHDPGDEYGLSKVGKCFIAGLLHHAEITAITNQTVNSYKRLIAGYEAPVYVCWARNNESALVRVPVPKKGKESSTRIEFRSPTRVQPVPRVLGDARGRAQGRGAGLRAAARGHEQHLRDDSGGARAEGIGSLPQSLAEAIEVMEGSGARRRGAREHVFEYFIRNKRQEWRDYKAHVSPWEIGRYLGST